MRILLVEDDRMIGEAVRVALKDASYAVDWVMDGVTASNVLKHDDHQVLVLDLALPNRDGLEVLRRLRKQNGIMPVIIITARDSVDDRIKGLNLGADDYLIKPFDVNELIARIQAVVRRYGGQAGPQLTNGILTLDIASHEVEREGKSYPLSAREYSLLHALLLKPGTILTRDEIEKSIYGWNEEIESNVIDFLIHGIRKKLGADVIKNVRGAGWMVAKDDDGNRRI